MRRTPVADGSAARSPRIRGRGPRGTGRRAGRRTGSEAPTRRAELRGRQSTSASLIVQIGLQLNPSPRFNGASSWQHRGRAKITGSSPLASCGVDRGVAVLLTAVVGGVL